MWESWEPTCASFRCDHTMTANICAEGVQVYYASLGKYVLFKHSGQVVQMAAPVVDSSSCAVRWSTEKLFIMDLDVMHEMQLPSGKTTTRMVIRHGDEDWKVRTMNDAVIIWRNGAGRLVVADYEGNLLASHTSPNQHGAVRCTDSAVVYCTDNGMFSWHWRVDVVEPMGRPFIEADVLCSLSGGIVQEPCFGCLCIGNVFDDWITPLLPSGKVIAFTDQTVLLGQLLDKNITAHVLVPSLRKAWIATVVVSCCHKQ